MKHILSFLLCSILFLARGLAISPAQGEEAEPITAFVQFSPHGKSLDGILKEISEAKHSIHVAAYSFTSKPIALALLQAHKRGIQVQVVADSGANQGKYSATTFLANNNVPVRLNSNYAILHHKFMVFDARHVETGSFNYSEAAASRNAENVLYIKNAPQLAQAYVKEWQRLWDEAAALPPAY